MADDFRIVRSPVIQPKTSNVEDDVAEDFVQGPSDEELSAEFAAVYTQYQQATQQLYTSEDFSRSVDTIDTNSPGFKQFVDDVFSQTAQEISTDYSFDIDPEILKAMAGDVFFEVLNKKISEIGEQELLKNIERAQDSDGEFAKQISEAMRLSILNPAQSWVYIPPTQVDYDDNGAPELLANNNPQSQALTWYWSTQDTFDEKGDFRKGMNDSLSSFVDRARVEGERTLAALPLKVERDAKAFGRLLLGDFYHSNPSAAIVSRWKDFVADSRATFESVDPMAFVQYVLRQCYIESNQDLQYFAERQKESNARKKISREYFAKLQEYQAKVLAEAAKAGISTDPSKIADDPEWRRARREADKIYNDYEDWYYDHSYSTRSNLVSPDNVSRSDKEFYAKKVLKAAEDKGFRSAKQKQEVAQKFWDEYAQQPPEKIERNERDKILALQAGIPDQIPPPEMESPNDIKDMIKKYEIKYNSSTDDAQLASTDLQNILLRQQEAYEMMSNVAKLLYDMLMSMTRNVA